MIDLQPFCGREETFHKINRPFSRGEFSYATNGHIMVRVPRRSDVEENTVSPATETIYDQHPAASFEPAPAIELPGHAAVLEKEECTECNGTGSGCECENCQCDCQSCDGTGGVENEQLISVGFKGAIYNRAWMAMMLGLPNLELGPVDKEKPLRFRFDGGEGLLMPMRRKGDEHFDIDGTIEDEEAA